MNVRVPAKQGDWFSLPLVHIYINYFRFRHLQDFRAALDFHLQPSREVALVAAADGGAGALDELEEVVRSRFRPRLVLAAGPEGTERPELMRDRTAVDGKPAAYVCERFICQAPVTSPDALAAQIGDDGGDGD